LLIRPASFYESQDMPFTLWTHHSQHRFSPSPRYHAQVVAKPRRAQRVFFVGQQLRHVIEVRLQRLVLRALLCDRELAALLLPVEPITSNSEHHGDDQEM
jgi:hypothetical protein